MIVSYIYLFIYVCEKNVARFAAVLSTKLDGKPTLLHYRLQYMLVSILFATFAMQEKPMAAISNGIFIGILSIRLKNNDNDKQMHSLAAKAMFIAIRTPLRNYEFIYNKWLFPKYCLSESNFRFGVPQLNVFKLYINNKSINFKIYIWLKCVRLPSWTWHRNSWESTSNELYYKWRQ